MYACIQPMQYPYTCIPSGAGHHYRGSAPLVSKVVSMHEDNLCNTLMPAYPQEEDATTELSHPWSAEWYVQMYACRQPMQYPWDPEAASQATVALSF